MFIICDIISAQQRTMIYEQIIEPAIKNKISFTIIDTHAKLSAQRYFNHMEFTLNHPDEICIVFTSWLHPHHQIHPYQARHLERWIWGQGGIVIAEELTACQAKTSLPIFASMNLIDLSVLQERVKRNQGEGAGNWNPHQSTLIIGERANHWSKMNSVAPFTDLTRKGCSAWLTDQLASINIAESELYWINAQREDKSWEDASFVEQLNPVTVVALGKIAATWCKINEIKHEAFDHPQYHHRFKHGESYPFIDWLKSR